jgi:hypothetical protein
MSIEQYPAANGVLTSLIWRKTAVGGETSLSGYDNATQALSYTPGQEQVYLNGILLVRGSDYTATNGTSITGLTALVVDDFVQINCYNNFSVASVPTASLTGTVTNAQLANSSITINGSAVALGGTVSLPGDIESVTASTGLSGGGSTGALTLTNTMATAIDAKGDLVVGTAADTFSKLGVGANGTVLTAASGEATGLSWATPSSGGMTLLTTHSLSGSTSTISSISGSYKSLFGVVSGAVTNGSGANWKIDPNGSTFITNTVTLEGVAASPTSYAYTATWYLNISASKPTGAENCWSFTIDNYASTTNHKPVKMSGQFVTSADALASMNNGGGIRTNSAITSLDFVTLSGAFTAGTVLLYGVS